MHQHLHEGYAGGQLLATYSLQHKLYSRKTTQIPLANPLLNANLSVECL